jgi:Mg-chelatase subunit ChlD
MDPVRMVGLLALVVACGPSTAPTAAVKAQGTSSAAHSSQLPTETAQTTTITNTADRAEPVEEQGNSSPTTATADQSRVRGAEPQACHAGDQRRFVVILVDRSGSMTGTPMAKAKEACDYAAAALAKDDWFAVVAFDSQAEFAVPLQPAGNRAEINAQLAAIAPG